MDEVAQEAIAHTLYSIAAPFATCSNWSPVIPDCAIAMTDDAKKGTSSAHKSTLRLTKYYLKTKMDKSAKPTAVVMTIYAL